MATRETAREKLIRLTRIERELWARGEQVAGMDEVGRGPLAGPVVTAYMIGAASIVAKVKRDRYMERLDERYPQYGFKKNKGYGTAQHIAAIREYGPCPEHRMSFIQKF